MKNFEHEQLPVTSEGARQVPLFVVFDLDRTLLVTNKLVERIWELLPELGVSSQEMGILKAYEISQRGKQLDLIKEIGERFEERFGVDELIALITEAGGDGLLYDGVSELLAELEENDVPAMIMTYGNQTSQEAKLKLTQLSLNDGVVLPFAKIVDHQRKAMWLAKHCLQTRDGRVVPAELYPSEAIVAQQIIVVDDKESNLETSAEDISGILVDNDGTSLDAKRGIRIGQVSVARLLQDAAA